MSSFWQKAPAAPPRRSAQQGLMLHQRQAKASVTLRLPRLKACQQPEPQRCPVRQQVAAGAPPSALSLCCTMACLMGSKSQICPGWPQQLPHAGMLRRTTPGRKWASPGASQSFSRAPQRPARASHQSKAGVGVMRINPLHQLQSCRQLRSKANRFFASRRGQ